jgi:hypothetical protein
MDNLRIYAVDVGSIKAGNFGWARGQSQGGIDKEDSRIDMLANFLYDDLSSGLPVALGFEAPLFVPIREEPGKLTLSRDVDPGGRPWSARAGGLSLGVATVQMPWLMRALFARLSHPFPCFFNWHEFIAAGTGLFIWEAVVTGKAKDKKIDKDEAHLRDASKALEAFKDALPDPTKDRILETGPILNLAGCALIWSGLSTQQHLMHQPCLVIEAQPDNE